MKTPILMLLPGVAVLLAACSRPAGSVVATTATPAPTESARQGSLVSAGDLTRTDTQGAVVVEVTPLGFKDTSDWLKFEVTMNTHSVNLDMDLAPLAMLTTDTGASVPAESWDGPSGGHHVSGTLVFPAFANGESILDRAHKLTLTILKVDAPSRSFEWDLR